MVTTTGRARRSARNRRTLIAGILFVSALGAAWPQAAGQAGPAALPEASPEHLPRWRGFNLPDMVSAEWARGPFHEEDFRLIARLGFNFVRLPLDYRSWIEGGDWERIDAAAFAGIDQAVQWGIRYGVHVCLNLHRAPGYCVNPPAEPRNLFTDARAQRVCALHWAFIARRYRGIPNRALSFNLLNEPGTEDGAAYARIVSLLCDAIRREDPDRLIIADGLSWGMAPCPQLVPLRVAQATRGYQPLSLTHYRADWVDGADVLARTILAPASGERVPVRAGPGASSPGHSRSRGRSAPRCACASVSSGCPSSRAFAYGRTERSCWTAPSAPDPAGESGRRPSTRRSGKSGRTSTTWMWSPGFLPEHASSRSKMLTATG